MIWLVGFVLGVAIVGIASAAFRPTIVHVVPGWAVVKAIKGKK